MISRRRLLTVAIAAVVVVGTAAAIWSQGQRPQQQRLGRGFRGDDGPVPVIAALTRRADVPVYLDGVGTTRALNTVTVRPQVEGKLISVGFNEGQDVKRGDVLARIDPTTYQAQLDQAIAKKAQDEAQLANARIDLERYSRLVASNSIARQQLDTQKATVAQLEAQVRLDQAAIDNAKAILDYTTIVAARRPHRHPAGRRRQHRARLRPDRHRRHHPDSADRGPVHAAAAAARRGQPCLRRRPAAG